jgi:hypothetical protein
MLLVQYVHLAKAKPIHKKQPNPLIREDVTHVLYDRKGSVRKKKSWASRAQEA